MKDWESVREEVFTPDEIAESNRRVEALSRIIKAFTYQPPKEGQPERYTELREKAKEFALLIFEECPESREKSLALTKLEEAVMWANASIARNE